MKMVCLLALAACGLPFVGWALGIFVSDTRLFFWTEVPAEISEVQIYYRRVAAKYLYIYDGVRYLGSGVSRRQEPRFLRRIGEELEHHRKSGRQFRCFVNPSDPSEALLYRSPRYVLSVMIFAAGLAFFIPAAWYRFLVMGKAEVGSRCSDVPGSPGQIIIHDSREKMFGFVMMAVVSDIFIAAPILLFFPFKWAVFCGSLAIPACLAITVVAVRLVSRRVKYGDSAFGMAPAEIGGELSGTIRTRNAVPNGICLYVTFRCIRRTQDPVDRNKTKDHTIWEKTLVTAPGYPSRFPEKTEFSVFFPIPEGLPETDYRGWGNEVYWELKAEAGSGWLKYEAVFRVPVFRILEGTPLPDEEI